MRVEVKLAADAGWTVLRDVRLRALRDAPHAFASPLERELAFGEDVWRRRARGSDRDVMLLAYVGDDPVGLAGAYVPEDRDEPELVSMWVDPRWRRRGVGEALIEAVVEWARTHAYTGIYLRVTRAAPEARRLYERCGFVGTGEAAPFPLDEGVLEDTLRRQL